MSRSVAAIFVLLLCSPLMADDAPKRHDPIAQWLNDHSHEVMQGTLALMVLVGDHDTVDDALTTFDGMLLSLAAAESLKLVIDEPRPRDPAATDGFPSSHATTAFAFAYGINDWRGDWGPYAYAFAAGVGWARVDEGYHTTEQVLAGAALGLWIAGVSMSNNGLLIHRGSKSSSLNEVPGGAEGVGRFDGGPSVVLWRRQW
ncbi:MAG: phosphatase PAP2 family protein [Armatimonadota bacterium]